MKKTTILLSALIFAATFADARGGGGRGFSGGRGGSSAVRGGSSAVRGGSFVVRGGSSGGRGVAAAGARGSSGGYGGFSRALSHPTFGRATSFHASTRSGFLPSSRASFGRATSFHSATARTARRISAADAGGTSAPWATPGAKIISAGQQPVYSDPGNAGTHSVEGGGFIAMDQGHANDVGRAPGITWGRPDRAPSSGAGGGGSGGSSNGPAFDPSF